MASPREADAVASSTWFALSAALVWGLVPGRPAIAALLVLGLADPAASVVGRIWGHRPLGKGTWAGTSAFATVALAVLTIVVGRPEAIAVGFDDNLTVPLSTAAAVWVLSLPGLGVLPG